MHSWLRSLCATPEASLAVSWESSRNRSGKQTQSDLLRSFFALKTVAIPTSIANSATDGRMRERITIKFNVTNAVASSILSMNAQASLVHQITIIKTEIGPIRAIETTIAKIAIVETIEMMTVIRAVMMTCMIENGTLTEMTNVRKRSGLRILS